MLGVLASGCSATLEDATYDCTDRHCPSGWHCWSDHLCHVAVEPDVDTAVSDGGADASFDAGADAGSDAGSDAGTDAGSDAGMDAGIDAGSDGGSDAGSDAGHDAASGPCVVRLDQSNPSRTAPDGFAIAGDAPFGQVVTAGTSGLLDHVVVTRNGIPGDAETIRVDVYDGTTTARPLLATGMATWAGAPDFPGVMVEVGFATRPSIVAGSQYLLRVTLGASVPMAGSQPRGPLVTHDFYAGGAMQGDATRDLVFETWVCGP